MLLIKSLKQIFRIIVKRYGPGDLNIIKKNTIQPFFYKHFHEANKRDRERKKKFLRVRSDARKFGPDRYVLAAGSGSLPDWSYVFQNEANSNRDSEALLANKTWNFKNGPTARRKF